MAEHRTVARGKDSGKALTVWGEVRVADGVDTLMQAMQSARLPPCSDPFPRITKAMQLAHRDHAVLPGRQAGQLRTCW